MKKGKRRQQNNEVTCKFTRVSEWRKKNATPLFRKREAGSEDLHYTCTSSTKTHARDCCKHKKANSPSVLLGTTKV